MARRRAFTVREILVVLIILGVLAALLSVGISRQRRRHREEVCIMNFRQIGIALSNYATDFQECIASFTWRAGREKPYYRTEMPPTSTDLDATANQMVDLIRFRAERQDVGPIRGWLPGPKYSFNVFGDYFDARMPYSAFACPEDAFRSGLWRPLNSPPNPKVKGWDYELVAPPVTTNEDKRWVYSSTYELIPAAFSRDAAAPGIPTIAQGATDGEYVVPRSDPFGADARKFTEVTFPDKKVGVFDSHDRHHAKTPKFYADPTARQGLYFLDMSVRVYTTSDTDPGFQPNNPSSPDPTVFDYNPEGEAKRWYPAPVNPNGDKGYRGYYRWTRGGLKGRDVGGAVATDADKVWTFDDGLFERVFR